MSKGGAETRQEMPSQEEDDHQLRVLVAGEGVNDVGRLKDSSTGTSYQAGVLETIARKQVADGWRVVGTRRWRKIRKYKVGVGGTADVRNVMGLVLEAQEEGYDALLFARDSDLKKEVIQACEEGLRQARKVFPDFVRIAGGVAHPKLEAWVLALQGFFRTEGMRPQALSQALKTLGLRLEEKSTAALVEQAEAGSLERIPTDAVRLRGWLNRVQAALGTPDN